MAGEGRETIVGRGRRSVRSLAAGALLAALACLAAFSTAGCGTVHYTHHLLSANAAFQKAVLAGAEKHAPYEYWRAREYLAKAREEAGYSDFEIAVDYCRVARKAAEQALERTRAGGKARPETPAADDEDGGEPAP